MKTLIVKYLPSGENSKTQRLLELFLDKIDGRIEVLDLLKDTPPIHDEASIAAYYKRNYGGQKLSESESLNLAKQDKLKAQLISCDILVMAYPMHNFGMPAAVKAYMDSVIMKGETFEAGKKLMAGRKALTLYTSGGSYDSETFNLQYPNWDTITLLSKINFGFMGFDEAQVIGASLSNESKVAAILAESGEKIDKIVKKWYK